MSFFLERVYVAVCKLLVSFCQIQYLAFQVKLYLCSAIKHVLFVYSFLPIIYLTRCIERLCDLHITANNFTEAGFTVLKHAELLEVLRG